MHANELIIYTVYNFQDKENLQLKLKKLVKWADK